MKKRKTPLPPPPEELISPWHTFQRLTISVPAPLLAYPDLSHGAKLLYGLMSNWSGGQCKCVAGLRAICTVFGITRLQTAFKWRQELVTEGFIAPNRRGQGNDNEFCFLPHPIFKPILEAAAAPTNTTPQWTTAQVDFRFAQNRKSGFAQNSKSRLAPESKSRLAPESKSRLAPESKSRLAPESKSRLAQNRKSLIRNLGFISEEGSLKPHPQHAPNGSAGDAEEEAGTPPGNELAPIAAELAPYGAGPAAAERIYRAAQDAQAGVAPAIVAAAVAATTPKKPEEIVNAPAYFAAKVPEFLRGKLYPSLVSPDTGPDRRTLEAITRNSRAPMPAKLFASSLLMHLPNATPEEAHEQHAEAALMDLARYDDERDQWVQQRIAELSPEFRAEMEKSQRAIFRRKAPDTWRNMSETQREAIVRGMIENEYRRQYPSPEEWRRERKPPAAEPANGQEAARKKHA